MSKVVVASVVSILALALGTIFNVTIDKDLQGQIVDFICIGVFVTTSIIGVFRNNKKE